MQRESVRALKAEFAQDVLPDLAGRINLRMATASASPYGGTPEATPDTGIALGVVPGRARAQDRLAVRVQDPRIMASPRILGRLMRDLDQRARGEFDLRFIGAVASASAPPWHRCLSRPLRPGCSIAHYGSTAGTIGGFFTRADQSDGCFALSNNHVLARENRASIGDAILQPGPLDGGTAALSRVGALADFIPLAGGPDANVVDCGICRLDDGIEAAPDIVGQGNWMAGIRDEPLDEDDTVRKAGRTTGLTQGVVSAIEVDDVWVHYDIGRCRFDGQIEMEGNGLQPFALGGDSGSLVVDAQRLACGLIFAVSTSGGRNGTGLAYANPIAPVLEKLHLHPMAGPRR
jgi:hypothetical protein